MSVHGHNTPESPLTCLDIYLAPLGLSSVSFSMDDFLLRRFQPFTILRGCVATQRQSSVDKSNASPFPCRGNLGVTFSIQLAEHLINSLFGPILVMTLGGEMSVSHHPDPVWIPRYDILYSFKLTSIKHLMLCSFIIYQTSLFMHESISKCNTKIPVKTHRAHKARLMTNS